MSDIEFWVDLGRQYAASERKIATSILKHIGITVNWTGLPSTPKYLLLRDDLAAMCWLRRRLSFRVRREFEQVRFQNMQETLDATMKAGDAAMAHD